MRTLGCSCWASRIERSHCTAYVHTVCTVAHFGDDEVPDLVVIEPLHVLQLHIQPSAWPAELVLIRVWPVLFTLSLLSWVGLTVYMWTTIWHATMDVSTCCVCTCLFVFVCVRVYAVCVCVRTCVFVCVYVYLCVCTCLFAFVCVYTCVCCVCVCTHVCLYVCVCRLCVFGVVLCFAPLTLPSSSSLVNMTSLLLLATHTISQKSQTVLGSGPCAAM